MNETKKLLLDLLDHATENYLSAANDITIYTTIDRDGVICGHYVITDSPDKQEKFKEMEQCLIDVMNY